MNSGFLSRKSGQIGFLGKWINKEPVDCPTDNLLGSYSTVEADPASNPMVLVIVADVDMDGHTVHHRKVQPLGKGALQSALDEIADEIIAVASVQAG